MEECNNPRCEKHNKRVGLGIFASEDEVLQMKSIRTRISCSQQAMNPNMISQGVSEENIKLFIKTAIETKADNMVLEELWWESVLNKYSLKKITDKDVNLDFNTKEFYTMEKIQIEG